MKNKIFKLSSLCLSLIILMSSFSFVFSFEAFADTQKLPDFVDNSQSPFFPEIGNQSDLGACVSWGQTYYQFTYMMNRSMGVPTTAENTFSPSFNFNIINGGRGTGAWDKDGYNTMKEIGSVPLSTVPYNTKEWNNWFATEQVWKEAMRYRIKDYTYLKDIGMENSAITSPDDTDLLNIKTLLAQGEVLGVTTPIYSWDVERIKAHPDVPENDKYVDEYIVRLCDKSGQGHRLPLVGYNDNIWTDVNDNGSVDSGEMGAFKVANSWGTERHNKGFMWISYDALNMTSCVKDCPVSGNYRPECLYDFVSIEVIPFDTDADLYLRYTLNTADRSQGKVYATATDENGKEYTLEVGPKRMHGMTFNKFSYDGTTNANDGTMVFALSNIVPDITSENLHKYTWSIKFEDTNADSKPFTVKNMEIVDENTGRISKPSNTYPFTLDGSSRTVSFPAFEEYVSETTAQVITTAVPVTTEQITTQPVTTTETQVITTTVPVTSTVTNTTEIPTTVQTDPVETTTEQSTTAQPTEITTVPTSTETEPVTTAVPATTSSIPETTAEVTTASKVYEEFFYGDANNDGAIKINDATIIQKFIAQLVDKSKLNLVNSDCNADEKVNVKDATCIQKYLAKLENFGRVGEKLFVEITVPTESHQITTTEMITTPSSSEVVTTEIITDPTESTVFETSVLTDPTEATTIPVTTTKPATQDTTTQEIITTTTRPVTTAVVTEAPTTTVVVTEASTTVTEPKPVINQVTFTNSYNWSGTISCYYWSDDNQTMTSWPGVPMNNAGLNDFGETIYTLDIPENATYVIFTNGTLQTVDIPYSGGKVKFYPEGADSDGKYTVQNW